MNKRQRKKYRQKYALAFEGWFYRAYPWWHKKPVGPPALVTSEKMGEIWLAMKELKP